MLVGIPTCGSITLTIESHERIQTSRPIYLHKMSDLGALQLVASEHAATMALPTVLRGREIAHPESLLVRSMRANRRCREFVSIGKLNDEEIASIDHVAADHMRSRLAATIFADIAYVNPLSLRVHYDCRPVVAVEGATTTTKKKEPHVPQQVAGLVFAVIRVVYFCMSSTHARPYISLTDVELQPDTPPSHSHDKSSSTLPELNAHEVPVLSQPATETRDNPVTPPPVDYKHLPVPVMLPLADMQEEGHTTPTTTITNPQ